MESTTRDSGSGCPTVSSLTRIKSRADAFQIFDFEFLLGAEKQNAQILPVHAEFATDFIPITFVKEDGGQKRSIPRRQVEQNLANFGLELAAGDDAEGVSAGGVRLRLPLIVERLAAGGRAVMLEENVVTHRVDEGSEARSLAQCAFLAERSQHSGEGLLAHVLNGLRRLELRTQLEVKQRGEIGDEVLLRLKVSSAETFDVTGIE